MKIALLALTLTSSIFVVGCNKTEFQFGQEPASTPELHDVLGNVHENQQLDVLAPITENSTPTLPTATEPVKVVNKRLKANLNANSISATPSVPVEATPLEATSAPAPVLSNWQPNEALLIRGNELLAGLQKEMGKKPSTQEMQKRLQSHMGLNAAQAQQIIKMLGLN